MITCQAPNGHAQAAASSHGPLRREEILATHFTHAKHWTATGLDNSWRLATLVLNTMAVYELQNAGLTVFELAICSSGPHAEPAQLWWLRNLSRITCASSVRQLASLALSCPGIPLWLYSSLLLKQGSKAIVSARWQHVGDLMLSTPARDPREALPATLNSMCLTGQGTTSVLRSLSQS